MNQRSRTSETVAWVLAFLTAGAAVIVIFTLGMYKEPGILGERIYNWPIIIASIISTVYAFLYATLFAEVMKVSDKSDETVSMLNRLLYPSRK